MGILSWLTKTSQKKEVKYFLLKGAKVVDVRTAKEYKFKHASNSINIPLDELKHKLNSLKAFNLPIIFVCHSGTRARMAMQFSKSKGIEAINAGSWKNI